MAEAVSLLWYLLLRYCQDWVSFRLPPDKYPVLALKGAPATFPMWEAHVPLQAYLHFSDSLQDEAENLKRKHFGGSNDYVGIHLRNGPDWVSQIFCIILSPALQSFLLQIQTCELVDRAPRLMSSYQCLGFDYKRKLTYDMCLPSVNTVIRLTKAVVEKEGVKYLLVATDKDPMISQFQDALPNVQVRMYSLAGRDTRKEA